MEAFVVEKPEQLASCLKLRKDVFVGEQAVPEELEIDELDALDAPCRHILLTDRGEPVATARVKAYDGRTAKVQRVAVRRESRGQGCGRLVMEAAERAARELGYDYAVLDAQLQARSFYERLGYAAESEETFYDAGILHVRLKKKL